MTSTTEQEKGLMETFWKLYCQDYRVIKIYEEWKEDKLLDNFRRMNPLSQINPEKIRHGLMVELNKENEEKYDWDLKNALNWSGNNTEMRELFVSNGYDRNSTTNKVFISKFYKELFVLNREITSMELDQVSFRNLKHLDVSNNKISHVAHLPDSIEEFIAQRNQIVSIARNMSQENLKYLNLGSNPLKDQAFDYMNKNFPNLKALDQSYCHQNNVQYTLSIQITMKKLRMLYMIGNPFTLLRGYFELAKTELPNLKFIDGKLTKLEKDPSQMNQIKTYSDLITQQSKAYNPNLQSGGQLDQPGDHHSKSEVLSSKSSGKPAFKRKLTDIFNNRMSEFQDGGYNHGVIKLAVTVSVRNLEGIKSVDFSEGIEDANSSMEKYQSHFWFKYNLFGKTFSTEADKVPHSKSMKMPANPEKNITDDCYMLDFGNSKTLDFELTAELYKSVMKGFHIEVFHSEPYKELNSDGDETENIIVKTESLGISIVSLNDLTTDSNLTTTRKKYPIFVDQKLLKYPNAYFPDPEEKKLIESHPEDIQRIMSAQNPQPKEDNVQQNATKTAPKKGGKPEPKKAPPKGKDTKVVEEVPAVAQLNWEEDPRNIMVTRGDYLGRKELKSDLNFFVASKASSLAVQISLS